MAEPTLDGLPVELKIIILSQIDDRDTLRCLVHASPAYHQAYLTARHQLLRSLVERQYDGFLDLAEALTAIRSKGVLYGFQDEKVIYLLDNWRRRDEIRQLSPPSSSRHQLDQPDGLEEIIKLLQFHKMLCFFIEDFSTNDQRPPWIQPVQWEREHLPLHLSPAEKHRFLRAICRLQILQNIFGDPILCSDPDCPCSNMHNWQVLELDRAVGTEGIRKNAYRLFYGPLSLWEIDEMGSVFGYLYSKIMGISAEVEDDLRQLCKNTPSGMFCDIIPKEQRPPACELEADCNLDRLSNHFTGLAGLGPEFLYRLLHLDQLSRRNHFCENARSFWPGPFIGYSNGMSRDAEFPFVDPADRLEASGFEHFWSTLSSLDQPTVGWKKAWLLPHTPDDPLEDCVDYNRDPDKDWEWCYALWDETRLREWKAPLVEEDGQFNTPGAQISN
ncbi:hypothetical protein P170DRAFT_423975 [Aspergillus steynii IBT 23096]|uniref:F-box domain-containing protein n=1 Tax=Aspergillus steynii IBT 23096 TaxID=1392250 RepID=A0A2I2GK24_9EURO|nr:uncharacterized protein P170DRAFT_423975 [Aspergillus steynii IBT 23096]PLB53207.1 hypothetical protein P170DRAFT_423975 [Aspergillus steynii IBT 23096]